MSELAGRYARALFSLCRDEEQFRRDTALLTGVPELWTALCSPCIHPAQKCAVLERLLGRETGKLFLNFYRLLCRRGRIALLPEIRREYRRCLLESENAAEARMRCAAPPNPEQQEALKRALCQMHGKARVDLQIETQPDLLGGFVLEIGDVTYDRSIRGMARRMRRDLERVRSQERGERFERQTR